MFKYDKRHRDALRRVILGIEEKDDEKENKNGISAAVTGGVETKFQPKKKKKRKRRHQGPYVLPKGWTYVIRARKSGNNYKIYIDPKGIRHRTRPPSETQSTKTTEDALTTSSSSTSNHEVVSSAAPPKTKKKKKKKSSTTKIPKIQIHEMPVPVVSKNSNSDKNIRPISSSGKEMGFRNDSELPSNWKVITRKRGGNGGTAGTYVV